MKQISVKDGKDAGLKGVSVEIVRADGSISRVVVTDSEGNYIEIAISSYSMSVYKAAPPEEKKVWRLKGKYLDMLDVQEDFENEGDAQERLDEYASKAEKGKSEIGLAITKETVLA